MAVVGFRKDRRTGKTIPITVPLGNTIPSKIFPNQTTFSVTPKNAELPPNDDPTVEDELQKFWDEEKLGNGIDAQSGDCANFAEALQNTIGKGTVVCAYADENDKENEEPTHCALKVGNNMYDAKGEITKKELIERTKLMKRDGKPIIEEATVDSSSGEVIGYRGLLNPKRVAKIQKVLQQEFDNKKM